jgi:trans-aconitate 2-methyltransferase
MADDDAWDPEQYGRFARERRQPFDDLMTLLEPVPGGRALDMGCGTGELTVDLHRRLGVASTVGIDTSGSMLRAAPVVDGVRFELADLTAFEPQAPVDVVAANASLQWVPDHGAQLARLTRWLAPGGQVAVQVPTNADHPAHALIAEVAGEAPFASAMHPDALVDPVAANVLPPARYAELLHQLGFTRQHVRLQVYGHLLASTAEVVEWTRGTTLTRIEKGLPPELFAPFVARYRERLLDVLGDQRPYFYAFKRILVWGRVA